MKKIENIMNLKNIPLSSNQNRLWIQSQLDPSDPSNNIHFAYHIEGEINFDILKRSIELIFQKHHTLHSVFESHNGVPYISIVPKPVLIESIDFSGFPQHTVREEILEFSGSKSRIPFDLENGPLYRIYLLKENEQSWFFNMIIHNIIFDGTSRRIFIQELNRIYNNLIHGINEIPEPLKYHSYDFVGTEKESLSQEDEMEAIGFWKEYLKDCPPGLKFPYDHVRTNIATRYGHTESFQISRESSINLRKITKECDTSLFKTLLPILGILFNKYTGDKDICIGIPVSNRSTNDSFKVIGSFVDTIPLRMIINEEENISQHIRSISEIYEKTIQYKLPFDKIVRTINPERITGLNPFYQVSFFWLDNLNIPMELGGICGKRITIPLGVEPFDITFYMWENDDVIEGEIQYNTDLFKPDTIIRLLQNMMTLIDKILENKEISIKFLSMISAQDLALIERINDTRIDYPKDKTIIELFEEQVNLYPDKHAVVFKDNYLTYNQLNEKVNQLARVLRNAGLIANDPVAILVERSIEMIIGIYGILKAGGSYVPIDPEYPQQRIDFIIKDSGSKILITQDKFISIIADDIIKFSLDSTDSFHQEKSNVSIINVPTDLAYIMFTSGTTGIPKGSLIRHRGVVRLVRNNYIVYTPDDKVLLVPSFVFDMSIRGIFGSLLNGSTLYITDKETLLDINALGELLLKNEITIMTTPTALFIHIAELSTDIFCKLKVLTIGGDVLSAPHVNKVRKNNPQLTVINTYGPTENSTNSTNYKVDRDFDCNIPIGKPINNSTAYIFDKNMNYQPIGIIGELYVGGDGVSPGYLNRDDLNSSRFVQHPFKPTERLYKTGDYTRWLPDGNIEFHGRMDNQLKIRGFRVELGEIESLISQIDGIVDVVVKPLNSTDKDIRLIAFLNVPEDFKMDTREILGILKSKLPSYMIPYGIKLMNGFPLTINGKTDKRALIYEERGSDEISREQETLSSATEEKLYNIWSEILRTKDIGRNDSFFESGGNSLLAISLMNKITLEFGISISFRDLIIHSSIADLGKYIDENSSDTESSAELVHLTDLSSLPLTQSQARIWLITKLNPSIPNYILPYAYSLNGPLKIDIFRRSIDALFSRHHVLFSRIIEREGVPFYIIEKTEVHIEFTDYSDINIDEGKSRIFEFINKDARRIFDLTNGPLYRLYLFKLSDEEFCFYSAFHHIVTDGWSWKIFIDDLNQIYNDLEAGREVSLKELPYQQYDFAYWEKQTGLLKDETKLIDYWKRQLEGCSSLLNFPHDFTRLKYSTGFGEKVWIQFPPSISAALRQISKNEGVSLFATMMSSFGILLNKYSGDNDINIGTPVANRSHSSFESVIGMFVNTLAIRIQLDQEISFKNLLRRTNEAILDAITYQDLQFEKIVEIVNPERFSDANPIFQVIFAWEDNLSTSLHPGNVNGKQLFIPGSTSSSFDLSCALYNNGDCIEGSLIYNCDLISKDTAVRLCDNFLNLVSNLVASYELPIASVAMISDKEIAFIDKLNDTRSDYPGDKSIVQLFEEQVRLFPDKIAVVFKDDSFTYEQLNSKSNQLAFVLRNKGVKTNDPVAIMADKSIDMIVGILGILKAGGAYMPLDPEYPDERRNYVIMDSGCRILLTQEKYINLTIEDVLIVNLNSHESYYDKENKVENINTSSDLAYILYTSGTTGKPKGSLIRQQSVVRLVRNTNYIDFPENIRTLLVGAIVFDLSAFEIWATLLNGGSLYIIEKETILDHKALGIELISNEINILLLSTGLFTYLAESGTHIFRSLKYLLVAGDVLSAPHINNVRKNCPLIKVINGYGPTENAVFSTCFEIKNDYDINIPIGKPISNSTAYIFDKNMNYQPIGIIGELYVGGDGVSPGYLNKDDLNRKSFLQHPYIPGERLYKTGDYARWLPDGNIEFHGRMDNQLKIRGFRVELGEIESLISQIDGIVDVVVKPLNSTDKDIRLIAFLNVPEDFKMDNREILGILKSKLPSFMIPYGIKLMHGFPLTINGKTDKKALIFNENESEVNKQEEELFTTAEEKVLKLWSELLRTREFRRNDNFFDAGGNSLLAISLINKLKNELGVSISYRDLIIHSSIADLGKYIDENSSDTESSAELVHLTDLSSLPLTQSQARIWLITKLNPIPNYIVPLAYLLNGPLKIDIFQRSIDALFSRHHVLFSRIIEREGAPFCMIEKTEVHIEFTDYSDINIDEGKSRIFEFINKDTRRIFDLTNGPLYRLYLFKLSDEEFCFYCAFHHIVFDGWSWKIFIDDLNQIYNDLEAAKEISLKELPYQQYDFAHWEKQTGLLKDETKLIDYWKRQLEGCSSLLNFPHDFTRLKYSTGFGEKVQIQFPPSISDALRQISKNEGVSLFATMMSAFGILLNKYSGDNDINIGAPVANRSHSSFESVIGMFVNTLAIRIQLDQKISFKNLLRRTNEAILDAITYQDLQFEKIVDIVNPERFSDANPIFQVILAWEDNLNTSLHPGKVNGKQLFIPGGTASSFDLSYALYNNGDCIEGSLLYNCDLIRKDTAVRLCDNFLNLVSNLVASYELPIASVSMISDEEKNQVLKFTDTKTPYPKDKTIAQLFVEQASLYPNKKAVVFQDYSLTYDQLNSKANQLARVLRNSGVRANDPVAIMVDRSVEMIIGIFGILKAGGAYVPIDPEYPELRKSFILKDSGCRVIITQDKYISENAEGIIKFSLDSSDSFHNDSSDVEIINVPTDLAYILYTSGTTGNPKGTLLNNRGVIRMVRNNIWLEYKPDDNVLLIASIVFDASTEELFGALLNGATLSIADKETILDVDALGELLIKNNITVTEIPTALFIHIAELSTDIFCKLRVLIVGGDVLPATHVNKVRKNNPQLTFINAYGPTENSCNSATYTIDRDFEGNIPIGKPISNSTAYIFDKNMNYQPIGIIGELYVGGDGVSPGYLNRDDLNRKSFLQHPYIPGERLYKTGDYARWLPDGNIEFHGRMDNQLKIRGFRVELGEIESLISQIDGIVDVVVKPLNSTDKDIRLIAFLNVPEDFKMDNREILGILKSKLPSYMIPYGIKLMHGFPLTINGKTDKKALIYDEGGSDDISRKQETLSSATEEKLYNIWSKILRTKDIGRNDSFFESGGNSLLAISLMNKITMEFGISISFRDLIIHSSIADLGKYIDENSSDTESSAELVHLTDLNNLPLTQSQARIWLITQLNPAIPNYIVPFAYRLNGPLKIDIFQSSIDALFSRHHVLFSRIIESEGVPCCIIEKTEVHIEFTDYSDINTDEGKSRIFEFINKDARLFFNLANGPLYRLYLFKLSDEEYYFYCAIHHIVFDGWSWKIFIDDLNQIYNDLEAGREISLKELPYQQYDFAHWEKQTGLLKDETKLIDYWKSQLEGCSTQLNFPYDFPRLNNSTGLGEKERIEFSPDISSALRQISKNEGVSLFATMISVFGILLNKYSGDNDINIGTPVANRSHSSFESVIGMFVNTLAIRMQLDQEISFNSLLKRTNEVILDAITNQDLQFEKIVEIVNPERFSNVNPVFQVAFAWEDNLNTALNLGNIKGERVNIDGGTSLFDITCSLYNNGDRIEGTLIYNIDLISKDTMVRLCDNFVTLVSNLVNNSEVPISSVPIITDNEKQKILSFTETTTQYPKDKTIVQLFEEKVSENPHNNAVVFHNDCLTYDQLNCKSNKLARTLRKRAEIKRDTPIGILADKSTDLIVGILSILKSGGAYLPIDPEYPQQRIDFIIRDAGCRIILTQDKYMNLTFEDVLKISLNSSISYNSDDSNVENINSATDLAYIMYTSGTTGVPKGTMIMQQSVVRLVRNTNYIDLQDNTRILLTGAIVFDASTFEIWGTLLNGGSLYIAEKETILDAKTLGQELIRNDINILWLTSALFTNLSESQTNIFGKLKYLLVGGDVLSVTHINKVRKENPYLKVINGYGPTENTTFSTCFEINREYDRNIPIGKPISNSTAYIFDKSFNYQPIGIKGELYVGGDGVSRGYLNREDLNILSFIKHPYITGERLYKTGDYARWLPDGSIEFLGRTDNQVKIRGFRIELEEIETVLAEIEGIKEAVVKQIKIDENDVRLVAFLKVPVDYSIDLPEVSKRITGKLPPYMVPYFYKTMHKFPITVNGKIDRKSLTIDLSEIKEEKVIEIGELSSTQIRVLKIWQDIIKTRSIGINENFFDAGGTSLLAVRVVDRIEKEFNISFELRNFFNNPIIQKIAEYIDIKINPLKIPGRNESIQKPDDDNKIIKGEL